MAYIRTNHPFAHIGSNSSRSISKRTALAAAAAVLIGSVPSISVGATYLDCRQYGGSKTCKPPEKTPWRMGADSIYFDNWVPPYAEPYCRSIKLEQVAAGRPNAAVAQYMAIYTEQVVYDCWLDMSGITQVNSCDALPEAVMPFDSISGLNRSAHPYWGKKVIAIPQCDVRQWSSEYPGSYYPAPYPWRDGCGAKAEPVEAPSGRILCIPEKEIDEDDCNEQVGNPIMLPTGSKVETASDYSDARGDLTFKRVYNSNLDGAGVLGRAWSSEYDARIYHDQDAPLQGGVQAILARRGSGIQVPMAPVDANTFKPVKAYVNLSVRVLRDTGGSLSGYLLSDGEVQEQYDINGLLKKIVRDDGYTRTLVHDSDERLQSVTDSFGRRLEFTYTASASQKGYYIAKMKTPAGTEFEYFYSEVGPAARLVRLQKPDGKSRQYVYDTENRLTGVVDELGVRYSTFAYDANGDAVATWHAGDVDMVQTVRSVNSLDGSMVISLNNKGVETTRQYMAAGGRYVLQSQSKPAGSGCSASTQSLGYDTNLNVTRVDRFGGTRICRTFDQDRNLPLTEIAGLGSSDDCAALAAGSVTLPATAAKTTRQWHPDFRKVTRVASPKNLATFVYNGQPDPTNGGQVRTCAPAGAVLPDGKPIAVLCAAIEQATLDESGAAGMAAALDSAVPVRKSTFTYNANGQMLTRADSLGNVTTLAYHATTSTSATVGDLLSLTPPKGLAWTLPSYNKDGYPLSQTDSNGLASSYQYDALNRVQQAAIGSVWSSYAYDDKGRLKQVDGVAGERTVYAYDDADRLIQIQDKAGNSVTFVRDNAGNAIREEYKDPTGALKRWLERGFDALNRLSHLKGLVPRGH